MNLSYYLKTYGCQMSENDAIQIGRMMERHDYRRATTQEAADVILISTCSVREKATQKLYSDMGRLQLLKLKRPEMILCVAGCQAEAEGQALLQHFPYLDLVVGPDHIGEIPELISQIVGANSCSRSQSLNREQEFAPIGSKNRLAKVGFEKPDDYKFIRLLPDEKNSTIKAMVTIMKGCDNFCAFCIVPFVRGREVCREATDVLNEIKQLASLGIREVVLLGQNVNSYGVGRHETEDSITFAALLEKIASETAISRIRFTTSHPKDLSDELVHQFKVNTKLAKHFHLPVQSGSDAVLKSMSRGYTREQYLERLNALRQVTPDIAISSDVIVGFPGEQEEDFDATMRLIEEVQFDSIYSFVYSPRPKTTAASHFKDDVPLEEKKRRLAILQGKQNQITFEKNKKFVGSILEVLIEGKSKTGLTYCGRSSHNHVVHVEATEADVNKFVPVLIEHAGKNSLKGKIHE